MTTQIILWTTEQFDFAKALYEEGSTFQGIADSFNAKFGTEITRGCVIGKFRRWKARHKNHELARVQIEKRAKPKPTQVVSKPLPSEPSPPDDCCDLLDLNDSRCRWPFGTEAPYKFCGAKSLDGSSYCEWHHARGTAETRGYEVKMNYRGQRSS